MNESSIAVRYAKALFMLALEKNNLEQVREDMLLVQQVLIDNNRFELYLDSPVIQPSQKRELIKHVFQEHLNTITFNFLDLLIQNKRENYLGAIFRKFQSTYREYKGIQTATITSAVPMDQATREKFQQLISDTFHSAVELTVHSDENLIGGFILRVGDQQYDASVATGLKRMRRSLLTEK